MYKRFRTQLQKSLQKQIKHIANKTDLCKANKSTEKK